MSKKMWKKLSALLLMVVMVLIMSLSVQAAAVKMNKAKATLYPGQKVTLKVTGTSKKAKWSSSNAKVAKVSKGKVTAVKKGKATIKAKVGKKTYTCKITVKAPALSQKKLNVTVGSKATVKLNGTKIKSVSSSNKKVADYPAETLHETIMNFHNTVDRFQKFQKALSQDVCGRAKSVQEEIRFAMDREELCHTLVDMQEDGQLPLRVTHNDTKLNNIMIDDKTGKGICVIDLDTVMPGLSVNDFGDSIRFGATTAAEDERNLDKVSFDLHLYETYVKGFIEGCGKALTDMELEMLPMGAVLMTFECGVRFLTDYLEGDHYFKVHREGHNLDRCRTQFKLVKEMEEKLSEMKAIVQKYK